MVVVASEGVELGGCEEEIGQDVLGEVWTDSAGCAGDERDDRGAQVVQKLCKFRLLVAAGWFDRGVIFGFFSDGGEPAGLAGWRFGKG